MSKASKGDVPQGGTFTSEESVGRREDWPNEPSEVGKEGEAAVVSL